MKQKKLRVTGGEPQMDHEGGWPMYARLQQSGNEEDNEASSSGDDDDPVGGHNDGDDAELLPSHQDKHHNKHDEMGPAGIRGDVRSILLLLFLYLLQGIPLGLTASIPLILSSRHVSYAQQAVFSFAYWPFSLKLLWAPIVDSCWSGRIGRRKSWLVPVQYLLAIFMFVLSSQVDQILGDEQSTAKPNVTFLTAIFFCFNFLAATQDIAVDGWALTMLSKKNVGYASTCNAVGQTAGFFLGNVVFLALESKDFCNNYLRTIPQERGLVTLSDFVFFWAWVFLICTTLVLLLKRESNDLSDYEEDMGIRETYRILWKILWLKPVLTLAYIHLTSKVAFAAADGITGLKLVEHGVPKDKLALLAIPLIPLQIILPWIIGRYTAGSTPFNIYLKAYPFRIFFGIFFAGLVYYTPTWQLPDTSYPVSYYGMIAAFYCVHQVTVYCMFVATMAFHAQISDPVVGGTYMTLMNTVSNLGGNWPVTLVLSLVESLTWKNCMENTTTNSTNTIPNGTAAVDHDQMEVETTLSQMGKVIIFETCHNGSTACTEAGGSCQTVTDGYYALSYGCAVLGFLWWLINRRRLEHLQYLPKTAWSYCSSSSFSRSTGPSDLVARKLVQS